MAHEEAALVVYQQFVQFGYYRLGHPQAGRGLLHDGFQVARPVPASDPNPRGVDLPGPPHGGIDQGFLATAVGRLLGDGDELLGLDR